MHTLEQRIMTCLKRGDFLQVYTVTRVMNQEFFSQLIPLLLSFLRLDSTFLIIIQARHLLSYHPRQVLIEVLQFFFNLMRHFWLRLSSFLIISLLLTLKNFPSILFVKFTWLFCPLRTKPYLGWAFPFFHRHFSRYRYTYWFLSYCLFCLSCSYCFSCPVFLPSHHRLSCVSFL